MSERPGADSRPGVVELWLSVGVALVALAAARTYPAWRERLYVACPLLDVAGIPCPTCGGTRAMAALASGSLFEALAWNPLVALGGVGMVAWVPACLLMTAGLLRPPRVPTTLPWQARWAIPLLLAANWVYLLVWFRG